MLFKITDYLQANINTNFKFVPVAIAQISKIINQRSKTNSVGYHGISNNLLKVVEPILLNPLTVILIILLNQVYFQLLVS